MQGGEHEEQPRVVALLPNISKGPCSEEQENWAGWGLDQASRVRGWWDHDACTTGGGGLDPVCLLAGEGVGSPLTERVCRLLSEKGISDAGKEEAQQREMTIGQYVAAFPWLRASEQEALAPPSALLPPEARRTALYEGRGRAEEVPYLADFVLGRTEGGLALLRDLAQPALPPFLEDWPSRYHLSSLEAPHPLTTPTSPFAYLFLGPRGARSRLHTDDHSTHGWLLQLAGRKKVWLWPPGAFPYHKHTPHEVVLEPWHMLYIPFRWAHEVVALDDSLSVQWRHLCPECPDAEKRASG